MLRLQLGTKVGLNVLPLKSWADFLKPPRGSLILIKIFRVSFSLTLAPPFFLSHSLCPSILFLKFSVCSLLCLFFVVIPLAHSPGSCYPLLSHFIRSLHRPLISRWKLSWCASSFLPPPSSFIAKYVPISPFVTFFPSSLCAAALPCLTSAVSSSDS